MEDRKITQIESKEGKATIHGKRYVGVAAGSHLHGHEFIILASDMANLEYVWRHLREFRGGEMDRGQTIPAVLAPSVAVEEVT